MRLGIYCYGVARHIRQITIGAARVHHPEPKTYLNRIVGLGIIIFLCSYFLFDKLFTYYPMPRPGDLSFRVGYIKENYISGLPYSLELPGYMASLLFKGGLVKSKKTPMIRAAYSYSLSIWRGLCPHIQINEGFPQVKGVVGAALKATTLSQM